MTDPASTLAADSAAPAPDAAVLIGRFQPPHLGHAALLQRALALAPRVVVVVGSAHQARTPRNPWTWHERAALIRQLAPAADSARLHFLPVRDYWDLPRWTAAVRRDVTALVRAQAATTDPAIALVGHFKADTDDYLRGFDGWRLHRVARVGTIDATALRDAYFGRQDSPLDDRLAALASLAPPATLQALRAFAARPEYAELAAEWRHLRDYRAAWAGAPYPPVFVTVDAVVRAAGQVLLIRRAHAPGRGLHALPGGFIEPRETLLASALRELHEETALDVPEPRLRASLAGARVFDHPDRSQRGRIVTHAFHFELGDAAPPAVRAGDDAADAAWVPVGALAALEDRFHDDHFHILDEFLGLTDPVGTAAGTTAAGSTAGTTVIAPQ